MTSGKLIRACALISPIITLLPSPTKFFPLTDLDSRKTSIPSKSKLNLASDIWKRLFGPRSRRYRQIVSQIDLGMDINLFKLCSGLKVLGYFMILLVAAIIAVSYYAVVVLTCGPQLLRGGVHSFLAFSIIIIFHILVSSFSLF